MAPVMAVGLAIAKGRARAREAAALAAVAKAIACSADSFSSVVAPRREVGRALGKWRGSTLAGYLRGDSFTHLENFRCTSSNMDLIQRSLQGSILDTRCYRDSTHYSCRTQRLTRKARLAQDPPTLRFKIGVALYCVGQGGPLKVLADVASIGASTLRRWLQNFAAATVQHLKPKYMPSTPMRAQDLEAVQGQFAARRGLHRVALACDGTHLPFQPHSKKIAMDYRNFKGWYSILAVAFVDSFYRFFDIDVGYPGRAGDNTVLQHNWLLKAMQADRTKWLGEGGVILGDSGASDSGKLFMNPYHAPTDPERLWFNFCHSSTRFFVEQAYYTRLNLSTSLPPFPPACPLSYPLHNLPRPSPSPSLHDIRHLVFGRAASDFSSIRCAPSMH